MSRPIINVADVELKPAHVYARAMKGGFTACSDYKGQP